MPDPKNLAKKELFGSTIEKTREYTEGVKKYSKNLQKNKKSVEDGNGINIQGNKATAKPYEKKFCYLKFKYLHFSLKIHHEYNFCLGQILSHIFQKLLQVPFL